MRDALIYGGPDAEGLYLDGNVALAHRRLSIIDLSDLGRQPMVCGKWVISYNGEIYNYLAIREDLERVGISFKSKSDTEVIVRAFEEWGIAAVNRFRGMFAFAIWDSQERRMTLCRDRFGVKPLFWYYKNGLFLFASEIKAFHQHPHFDKTLDLTGLPHFLMKGYFKESDCIYLNVKKVQPGSFLHINSDGIVTEENYWDVGHIFSSAIVQNKSPEEWSESLEYLLTKSFALRMVADVPVGVFLSGGIDSALVTAILQKNSGGALRTFTIGFEDKTFNEATIARQIADKLGTSHTSIECTEREFKNVIPKLPYIYDEPFGDSSAIPTYLLSNYARKSVKVALSGDGGDELFGGYAKYKFIQQHSNFLDVPKTIRKGIKELLYLCSPAIFEKLTLTLGNQSYAQLGSKFLKLRHAIDANSLEDFFDSVSSYLSNSEIQKLTRLHYHKDKNFLEVNCTETLISNLGRRDLQTFLPGDVLTKVDRASMHVALETREPFLDPEILEFSFSLPSSMKISSSGETKFLLKKILKKYVPDEIVKRPKYGFTIPISDWMKNHLKAEITEMLYDRTFFETFQLNQTYISFVCKHFFAQKDKLNAHVIWFIYCLYKWYKQWV